MSNKRLIIVGGVAGGASAAARARRLCEDCGIIMFERGPHVSFANCGLPYFVGGEILEQDSLLVQTPDSIKTRFNLDVRIKTEVLRLDRAARRIRVREWETGREYEEAYDALILSTGASPLKPPIPGIERPNHFVVRNIPDVEKIIAWSNDCQGCRAVVVGGGYIGLEMAEQLRRRGFNVTVVEALPQVMAPLDPEMAAWLHAELCANGVALHLNDPVVSFEPPSEQEPARASIVVLKGGQRLPADLVVLGLGVKPEVGLAEDAGLEIGKLGGIRVNEHLQTSDSYIWAVGDAIEVRDGVTGQWALIPLAGPANRQGRIAAGNILGRPSRYEHTWGTAILRLFTLTAACTGANKKSLRRAAIPYQAIHLHPGFHAGYYPGAEPIALKVLLAPDTGKLLGAQAIGHEGVDKRIDVLATALKAGMTVHDLAELELAYAPPYGSAKDPVNLAGMAAQNVLAGDVALAQWNEVASLNPSTTLLLDVRRPDERARGFIPDSTHIPLDELRQRLSELPRDREIIVYCQSGRRSYLAARVLSQHGFRVRNLTGAYRTWRTTQPQCGTKGLLFRIITTQAECRGTKTWLKRSLSPPFSRTFTREFMDKSIASEQKRLTPEQVSERGARMKAILELNGSPVGVRLLFNESGVPAGARPVTHHRYCQAVMKARHGEQSRSIKKGCPARPPRRRSGSSRCRRNCVPGKDWSGSASWPIRKWERPSSITCRIWCRVL